MADITFECPECKQSLAIDAVNAGFQVQCPVCSHSVTVPNATNPATAQAFSYVGLFRRFRAGFVDLAALSISLIILNLTFGDFGYLETFFVITVGWIYFSALLSSSWQATVGMKLLKITLTDKIGGRITFARASVRYFASILSALPYFAGFLIIPFTRKKQGLHDMIAGTFVLKNEAGQEVAPISPKPSLTDKLATGAAVKKWYGRGNDFFLRICGALIVLLLALIVIHLWFGVSSSSGFFSQPNNGQTTPPAMTVENAKSFYQNFFNGNMNVRDEQGFSHSVPAAEALFDAIHPVGTGKSITVDDLELNRDPSGNLESVGLELTLYWDGPLQSGKTTFKMLYDVKTDQFGNIKVEQTDGITREDINDFAIGYQVGAEIHDAFSGN
jgi:uncharacterized RDD family membrane protein YckC